MPTRSKKSSLPILRNVNIFSKIPVWMLISYESCNYFKSIYANVLTYTFIIPLFLYAQFSSVTRVCLALCDPMDYSTPGFFVHHQFPKLVQTLVHLGDAIQPFHPLSSRSPSAFNLSQNPCLFQ